MKNWIIGFFIIASGLSYGQSIVPQELWTYTGVPNGPLSAAISETGTGSAFGTGASAFIKVSSERVEIRASGAANEGYAEGLSPAKYAGATTGIYQISYRIPSAGFFPPIPPSSGRLGWGLRSTVSGTDDCKAFFRQLAGNFELVVHDASGARAPVLIQSGKILTGEVTVRQLYFLEQRGNPGSFQVFYSHGGGAEVEVHAGQLSLPADFQLDEFTMEVDATSNGFKWTPNNVVTFDDLVLGKVNPQPKLTLFGQNVSFIQDNGVMDNTLYPPYEPNDVLQLITTNKNIGTGPATNVTTTISANSGNFTIVPSTFNFPSVAVGATYETTSTVTVVDAPDGTNTFKVINQVP